MSISPKDSVMEGKKAVLTCESDANPPVSKFAWFDWNNQNLQNDYQMLILNSVKVQHSGAYRCQAENRLGVGQSPPSTLTVYCKVPSLFSGLGHSCGFPPRLCIPDHLPVLPSLPVLPGQASLGAQRHTSAPHSSPAFPPFHPASPDSTGGFPLRLPPPSTHPEHLLAPSLSLSLSHPCFYL